MNDYQDRHLTDTDIERLLSGVKDTRLHAHLDACESCRERWQSEWLAHMFLRSAPWAPAPEEFATTVSQRILNEDRIPGTRGVSARPIMVLTSIIGAFLLIAASFGAGMALLVARRTVSSSLWAISMPIQVLFHVTGSILHTLISVLVVLFSNPTALKALTAIFAGILFLLWITSWYVWTQFRAQYQST